MSMTGWTQSDIDAYNRRKANGTLAPSMRMDDLKTTPSASPVASEAKTDNLIAENRSDAVGAKCNVNPKRKKAKHPKGQPNNTEAEYNSRCLGGRGMFQGVTFRLNGGSRYTPDWIYWSNGVMFAVEVKGAYRFGSEGRALVAFLEARAKFKNVVFLWVQKQENGEWIEKHVDGMS